MFNPRLFGKMGKTIAPTLRTLRLVLSRPLSFFHPMAFSAALILANKSYTVRHFNWGVQQNTDAMGRPDARVQGGQFTVELDSEPDEILQHWALDDTKKMSGELVVFSAANRLARRKTIRFEEAFCVGLSKAFDGSASDQGMTMTLTVSANKLGSGEVMLNNNWPV